jgi:hypothetical protein
LQRPAKIFNPDGESGGWCGLMLFSLALLVFLKFGMKMEPKFHRIYGFAIDISFMPVCGPVKAYPNAPMPLADPRASKIDLVIIRESTEGLFYSAAVHGRSENH